LKTTFETSFISAKENDERVFMTHITSTSHHPYVMPADETYVPLASGNGLDDLSHYVNSIGYDDRWLGKVLDVLEEQGVSNETLIVFAGDHGLSIPENDILASYYNPNVGCNHVPLGISHPNLPHINADDSISSIEILPTILDLLLETGSLSTGAGQAARDLIANYEGQSLIRKLRHNVAPNEAEKGSDEARPAGDNGVSLGNWQFIVMNPGRAMVGVRDARQKSWRLVAPVIENVAWRFTDLDSDPTEASPVMGFEFSHFLKQIEELHGIEAATWTEEAAFVTRWWVEENSKRWRYGPYAGQDS
jgi:arylsulfatase A-like enzyme